MQIRCTQADHENQLIMGFCIDSNCKSQRPYCHYCLPNHAQHLNKLILAEKLNEWIQTRMSTVDFIQKNAQECKSVLDSLTNKLLPYFNINLQQLGISQIDNTIKVLSIMELCEQSLFQQLNQSIEQVKSTINQVLNSFINQQDSKQNPNLQIQQTQIIKPILYEQQNQEIEVQSNLKPFTFELIKSSSIKQQEYCSAIAFNKDNSLVVAACQSQIKVFEFRSEQLKYIQLLSEHKDYVTTLNFMKKSSHLISGSRDNLIIIWFMNQNRLWICQQKLNGYGCFNRVNCLVLNNNEDVIISGSNDKTIKFWDKKNQWSLSQTITDHTDSVQGLSLNDQSNRMISCGQDSLILIIDKLSQDSNWNVVQKIKVDVFGNRLYFINHNQFTFQPFAREYMYVYEMNNKNKEYVKTEEISIKCGSLYCCDWFPQQYIKQKCLIVNKNGWNVNLIRKNQNGDFLTQQSIDYGVDELWGQMSEDGEYLITWDNKSKEIQLRKYHEKR